MTKAPSSYLVDTNVLSNRRDVERDVNVKRWLKNYASLLRVSVVTVAEMRRGLILLELRAAGGREQKSLRRERERLDRKRAWYDEVLRIFADRMESIDIAVAEKWAEISVKFPSLRDGDKAIAATALAKGYGVATENVGDFRSADVRVVNPFDPNTWDDQLDDDPLSRLS